MADGQSIQLLPFNFGACTFGYRRLSHGLNRSLPAFHTFVLEYLDQVVNADSSAQYVNDFGIGAHTADELLQNLELGTQQIQLDGLKLSMTKLTFRRDEIEFLAKKISEQGLAFLPEESTVSYPTLNYVIQ